MEAPVIESPKPENRTWPIVGTIAAILLCGCPGLAMCLFGAVSAFGAMPDFINGYGNFPNWLGFVFLCLAIVFIAIGVVVPILLLRKKKPVEVAAEVLPPPPMPPQEPLPPAS
jgi:uncharacterized membrane protein